MISVKNNGIDIIAQLEDMHAEAVYAFEKTNREILGSPESEMASKAMFEYMKKYCSVTNLSAVKDTYNVVGNVSFKNKIVVPLPENLTVYGNVDCTDAKFKTNLPEYLSVKKGEDRKGGNLILTGSGISHLPNNLFVEGDLDIRGTEINSVPFCLSVLGHVITDQDTELDIEAPKRTRVRMEPKPKKDMFPGAFPK